jgi:ubiquinone/menaquinone biosynthesis C-methylase UbiE
LKGFFRIRNSKETHELDYWKKRKALEGTLINSHYRHFFSDHFGLPLDYYTGKRILDVGCGPRGSLEWAEQAQERIGLDSLASAYGEIGANSQKMRYVDAPSESMPFSSGWFDVVSSFNSLDHVDDLEKTIKEIGRVTKPGGLFLLLVEVNHDPTPCEPIVFSWDVVDAFKEDFKVLELRHYEKSANGMYDSIHAGVLYDHSNPARRYGILSAKFLRLE